MGIGTRIALFVGVPAVIIVAVGFALRMFQPTIFSSATAIGQTLAGIFTRPVTGFFGGISEAFADLPDIEIKVPGINLTGGLFTFTQEEPALTPPAPGPAPFMGGTIETPPGCTVDSLGRISCPTPPIFTPGPSGNGDIIPSAEGSELTPREGSLPFQTSTSAPLMRTSIEEIIRMFPGAVGLFDIRDIEGIDFIPLSALRIQQLGGEEELRFSGQLFEEIRGFSDIF